MPLQRAGYSNIKQSLTLKKKKFRTIEKKCSNFNIFDVFALSLSNACKCFGPKSAKTRCLEPKFTHSHFAENRQVKSKTTEFGEKLLKAMRDSRGMAIETLKKSPTFEKKGSEKNFLKILNFFQCLPFRSGM